MAKRLEDRLTNAKKYREIFGENRLLTEEEIKELHDFDKQIGFNADRVNALVQFICLGYVNWIDKWLILKTLSNHTLDYMTILYGVEQGTQKYIDLNKRKTKKFDHSSETQRKRALISSKKTKGSTEHSIRSMGYWIKKGFEIEEAKEKIASIQRTNTLENYVQKYGTIGEQKFNERKDNWKKKMSDPIIGKKRSLGLRRYVERYGPIVGEQKYIQMRIERNKKTSIGKASVESLQALDSILEILERNNIKFYLGVKNNKEWFIYNNEYSKCFFYDLTIPTLSLIIEYHGEGFHPNPSWSPEKLNNWRQVRTNKIADIVLTETKLKNSTAINNGWTLIEVFSSDASKTVHFIIQYLNQLGYV